MSEKLLLDSEKCWMGNHLNDLDDFAWAVSRLGELLQTRRKGVRHER